MEDAKKDSWTGASHRRLPLEPSRQPAAVLFGVRIFWLGMAWFWLCFAKSSLGRPASGRQAVGLAAYFAGKLWFVLGIVGLEALTCGTEEKETQPSLRWNRH